MFKNRLVELRKKNRLSQYELAKNLGLSRGQISNYELGTRQPDFGTLLKIAHYFGVTTDYLLDNTAKDFPYMQSFEALLEGEADVGEFISLCKEIKDREELRLLFKEVRFLGTDEIKKVVKVIHAMGLEKS